MSNSFRGQVAHVLCDETFREICTEIERLQLLSGKISNENISQIEGEIVEKHLNIVGLDFHIDDHAGFVGSSTHRYWWSCLRNNNELTIKHISDWCESNPKADDDDVYIFIWEDLKDQLKILKMIRRPE